MQRRSRDPGMRQRDDPVLALLERAEDAHIARMTEPHEPRVVVGAGLGLGARSADRDRDERGDAERRRVPARLLGLCASLVRGRLEVVEAPRREDDVVDERQEGIEIGLGSGDAH